MWVTQTYLGTVEPDAKLFVYYFFEDYNQEQKSFTKSVQQRLEDLGEVFGDQVSLLMPNPRFAGRIEAEVRENPALWASLRGNLPGLFVSKVPLVKLNDSRYDCLYIPFEARDPAGVAEVIQRVRRLANETISWEFTNPTTPKQRSFGGRLLDAVEFKPGIWGFKIDIKKLVRE
jgi:hypothetical protein